MKNTFKILSLLLALAMLLGLAACSAQDVADMVEIVSDVAEIVEEIENAEPAEEPPTPSESQKTSESPEEEPLEESSPALDPDGNYTTKEDVALYIYTYGCLPQNFITKNEAREAGWEGGSLEPYFPGMCIGGDYFGNREGLLPDAKGREWTECDINTLGAKSRGAERIVFSNDGLIYYTGDHYESFTLLYGEP